MGERTNDNVSLQGFALGLGVLAVYFFSFCQSFEATVLHNWIAIVSVYCIIVAICVAVLFKGHEFQVNTAQCSLNV